METERYEAYKNPEIEQFLTKIMDKSPEVIPYFSIEVGYRYPDVEMGLKKETKDSNAFLENLSRVGILEKELYTMEIRCPKCRSPNVDAVYVCPFCKSININRDALIEHLACGLIDVLANYKSGSDLICPKCHTKLVSGSYRAAGSWYECGSCGKRVEFPTPQHKCRSCGTGFSLDDAIYDRIYVYSLSKIAKTEISHGILLRCAVMDYAESSGFEAKSPYTIVGKSGVEHVFDIMLLKEDEKIMVDILLSDDPVSQFEVVKEYAKLIDTGVNLHFIVIPGLSDDGKKLALFYAMSFIEADSPKKALGALCVFLGSEKSKQVSVTEKKEEISGFRLKSIFRKKM